MRNAPAENLFRFFKVSGRMYQQLCLHGERALPSGLTMAQFELLDLLKERIAPQLPMVLAAEMHLTRGSLTNLIQQLEKKQLIRLELNPEDGRSKLVSLSKSGNETHRLCLAALYDVTTGILRHFPPERLDAALKFSSDLFDWLDGKTPRPTIRQ